MEQQTDKNANISVSNSFISTEKYKSIGGWLILFVTSLIITFIIMLFVIINELLPVFLDKQRSILITPGSQLYDPLFTRITYIELFMSIIISISAIILLVFLFQKRKFVPKIAIIYIVFSSAYAIVDLAMYISLINHFKDIGINLNLDANEIREKVSGSLISAIVYPVVWVPYFLKSKRVKHTFIR
ncbi:DUF2569 domain-containing protein [Aneurinibacillus uraniidurans]|uniref:DUF2569 domain-containing protein n=1 Tax=Aneurinibacillus uraniidurans TaxID=2966586 RepID=UPI00234BE4FC|nr:DUF2569 domain-containing protein [Aneurinibacillus sp. B1]WCN37448.1 DUF2569 domain-containing protein [Aneurinibacillus sp. B1]